MSTEEEKNQLNKLKEQFSKGNKSPQGGNNGNKRNNFYWIYAGLLVLFIGIQIIGSFGNAMKMSNFPEFETMVKA